MPEPIELAIDSPEGIIDCRLDPELNEGVLSYSATILYPHTVNGFSRSEIYCHTLLQAEKSGDYFFEPGEEIHPKIKKLEAQLSEAIIHAGRW